MSMSNSHPSCASMCARECVEGMAAARRHATKDARTRTKLVNFMLQATLMVRGGSLWMSRGTKAEQCRVKKKEFRGSDWGFIYSLRWLLCSIQSLRPQYIEARPPIAVL